MYLCRFSNGKERGAFQDKTVHWVHPTIKEPTCNGLGRLYDRLYLLACFGAGIEGNSAPATPAKLTTLHIIFSTHYIHGLDRGLQVF